MDLEKLLKGIDDLLLTKDLLPEEQDRLYMFRGGVEQAMERQARARTFNALGEAFRRALELQGRNPFFGEGLIGGPRSVPGAEGAGIFIQPQQTPGTYIRSFMRIATRHGTRYFGSPALWVSVAFNYIL